MWFPLIHLMILGTVFIERCDYIYGRSIGSNDTNIYNNGTNFNIKPIDLALTSDTNSETVNTEFNTNKSSLTILELINFLRTSFNIVSVNNVVSKTGVFDSAVRTKRRTVAVSSLSENTSNSIVITDERNNTSENLDTNLPLTESTNTSTTSSDSKEFINFETTEPTTNETELSVRESIYANAIQLTSNETPVNETEFNYIESITFVDDSSITTEFTSESTSSVSESTSTESISQSTSSASESTSTESISQSTSSASESTSTESISQSTSSASESISTEFTSQSTSSVSESTSTESSSQSTSSASESISTESTSQSSSSASESTSTEFTSQSTSSVSESTSTEFTSQSTSSVSESTSTESTSQSTSSVSESTSTESTSTESTSQSTSTVSESISTDSTSQSTTSVGESTSTESTSQSTSSVSESISTEFTSQSTSSVSESITSSTNTTLSTTTEYVDAEDGPPTGAIVGAVVGVLVVGIGAVVVYMSYIGKLNCRSVHKIFGQPRLSVRPDPIPLKRFVIHCEQLLSNPSRINSEFHLLATLSSDLSSTYPQTAGQLPDNKKKNRYINILPYDATRVKLDAVDGDSSTDYINASYIKGYSGNVEYIACQGPKEETGSDFWRMVLQCNVQLIIMVTQFEEQNKPKCDYYFPTTLRENMTIGDYVIRCATELSFPDYTERSLIIHKGGHKKTVKHLHFLRWPDFGCPKDPEIMLKFCQTVREHINEFNTGLSVVHCSAGVGRTGTLITLDILLQHIKHNKKIDIFGTVYELRHQRVNMVQTEAQYKYIYECMLKAIQDPNFFKSAISVYYADIDKESPSVLEPIYENMLVHLRGQSYDKLKVSPTSSESETIL